MDLFNNPVGYPGLSRKPVTSGTALAFAPVLLKRGFAETFANAALRKLSSD
jgi:hypothetical protein